MCNPIALGLGTFAQGAFGALQGASQARARNRAAIQSYEHALNVRKHEWYQQLSVWGAKRNQYFQDINENDLAAQRGYAQAQVGLNRVWEGAMQSNEGALIQYLQNHGKLAAAGRTGRSIDRLGTLEKGQLERHAGRQLFAMTRAKHSFTENVENIRNQQLSHRNKLQARVNFAPMPDLAPPPPEMVNESAMPGMLMAAASGLMSYGMAGGKFGKGAKVPGSSHATSPTQPWLPEGYSMNNQAALNNPLNKTVLQNPGWNPTLQQSMGLGHNIDMDLFANKSPWWNPFGNNQSPYGMGDFYKDPYLYDIG